MLTITMPRGDIKIVRFQVYDLQTGDLSQTDFTKIYMSVKRTIHERDVLFQKRLSDGGIEKLGTGDYQIKIDGPDTESLNFNTSYPFDIELLYGNEIKQTEYGELELTPEVTCVWNEVK
jgi:hypothetical protein